MLLYGVKVNTAYGTYLVTLTAADALVIINTCAEVFNLYCFSRTSLHTLHTADAAGLTLFSCLCALVVVFTKNGSLCGIEREELYKTSGTGLDAHLTGTASVGIDSCNAVTDENCIIGADLNAVAEADTTVNAVFGTAEKLCCNFTRTYTAVFELFFNIVAVALTHNGSNGRDNLPCLKTHYGSNSLGSVVTAGNAETAILRFALCKSTCITVTACIAAGTAVCTGEAFSYLFFLFVNGNCKNGRGKGKSETCNKTDSRNDNYGN